MKKEHQELVRRLVKNPLDICNTLTFHQVNIIHAILGIQSEVGELVSTIKKHTIYNQPLDLDNVIEELGDLEFYLEQLRQELALDRDMILQHNIDKLNTRYPAGHYTDQHAKKRLDKDSRDIDDE